MIGAKWPLFLGAAAVASACGARALAMPRAGRGLR